MTLLPAPIGGKRRADAVRIALCGVGMAITAGVAAFATRDLFAALHGAAGLPLLSLGSLAICGIAIAGLRMLSRIVAERLAQGFAISLRHALFAHLSRMSPSFISGQRTGAIGLRFVGDLSAARGWVGQGLPRALAAAVVLPGAAIAAYLLNPVLAVAMSIPLTVAVGAMAAFAGHLEPLHQSLRKERSRIASSMLERTAVAPELAMIGRTRRELRRLDRLGGDLRRLAIERSRSVALIRVLPEMATAIAGVSVFWAANRHGVAAPEVAGALALLAILSLPLRELAGVWDKRCAWVAARRRYLKLLSVEPTIGEREHASAVTITFDQVHHRNCKIDLTIAAGERVLLENAGRLASSEFLSLAAALVPPEQGHIRYAPASQPPRALLINRRTPILKGSLRRALTLGAERRPNDLAISAAAEQFGLGNLLERPGGLDATVAEAGRDLEALDRLRLFCCRALLTCPGLVLVDLADLPASRAAFDLIRSLSSMTQATLLIAGGDQHMSQMSERRLVFTDGRLIDSAGGNGLDAEFEAA